MVGLFELEVDLLEARRGVELPKVFYVVTQFDREYAKGFRSGVLKGVEGVTDSPKAVSGFWGVAREALVVMNGVDFAKANKVRVIDYTDPDKLVENNFDAVKRIFNSRSAPHLIQNLVDYLGAGIQIVKPPSQSLGAALLHDIKWSGGRWVKKGLEPAFSSPPRINSVDDYTKFLAKVLREPDEKSKYLYKDIPESDYSLRKLKPYVEASLKRIGAIYASEGEWVIEAKNLKLVSGSELFIHTYPMPPDEVFESWLKVKSTGKGSIWSRYAVEGILSVFLAVRENGLDSKFKIKLVPDDGKYGWTRKKALQTPETKLTPAGEAAYQWAATNGWSK